MSTPHTVFALITDTHLKHSTTAQDDLMWNRQLVSQSEYLVDLLVRSLNERRLDFIIHAGDLTHEGDKASFDFVRASFLRLKAPVLFTLGNRDVGQPGIRSWLAAEWGLTHQVMYYTHHYKGVRYIFLDSNYAHLQKGEESEIQRWDQTSSYAGVGFSSAQLDWLRKELESDRETLTFVITHHPIASKAEYPIISPRNLGAPNRRLGPVWQRLFPTYHREVVQLLERAPNVKVVFTGHWHINDITRVNNLYHVKTSSLIEYPFEFRIVCVSDHFLDISVERLPSDSLPSESLVSEWQNEWIRGESFDRERRIYFDDAKIATKF